MTSLPIFLLVTTRDDENNIPGDERDDEFEESPGLDNPDAVDDFMDVSERPGRYNYQPEEM